MLRACGYVDESYEEAMLEREKIATTYMGMGIAIPHGTDAAKSAVLHSGIVVLQYPAGVKFVEDDEPARLVIGIAGVGDEHLAILSKVASTLEDPDVLEALCTDPDPMNIFNTLK